MRLSKLILKGFKSFANETTFHFDADVIGVVGPNGSGKSNVVDAIRWVLGEQKSKELRLEKMDNVIFNGSKNKRPATMAMVSLVFENNKNVLPTAFQTVEITRVLYKSGESEYRLNGVVCRLKDITNLFVDTGIGSNSYAIIALGMVDDILQDKDDARRKMFEQAAGISKFKNKKKDTIRQLNHTTADLDRVEDLLFEIEGNLKSLEKQAKKTKKFYALKEAYHEKGVLLGQLQAKSYTEKYKELDSKISQESEKVNHFNQSLPQYEITLEKAKTKYNQLEQQRAVDQREINSVSGKIHQAINQQKLIDQELSFIDQSLSKGKPLLEQLEERKENCKEELIKLENQRKTTLNELEGLEIDKQESQDEKDKIELAYQEVIQKNKKISTSQQSLRQVLNQWERKKAVAESQIQNDTRNINQLEQEQLKNVNRLKEFETNILEKKQAIEQSNSEKQTAEKEEEKRLEALEVAEQKLDDLKAKYTKVDNTKQAQTHEYKLLKSMVDSMEGFPESSKFLKKKTDFDAPILSDLIFCPEKYRTALENYLKPYLQYFVVKNKNVALEAIHKLQNSQKGKSAFFINNNISFLDRKAEKQTEIAAIDVVECDKEYKNLLNNLLLDVYFCESLPNNIPDKTTFVTLDGTIIGHNSQMTGGSVGLFEGKMIGRKKNIEHLKENIEAYKIDLKELNIQIEETRKELQSLKHFKWQQNIRNLEVKIKGFQTEVLANEKQIEQFDTQQKNLSERIDKIRLSIENSKSGLAECVSALDENRGALEKLDKEKEQFEVNIAEISSQKNKSTELFNQYNISIIQKRNLVDNIEGKCKSLESEIEYLDKDKNKNIAEHQSLSEKQKKLEDAKKEQSTLVEKLKLEKKESIALLDEKDVDFFKSKKNIEELELNIRNTQKSLNFAQQVLDGLKDSFVEVKLNLQRISERMKVAFGIDLNQIMNEKIETKDVSVEDLESEVEKLQVKIEKFGEINPLAVEAYDEMLARHQEITQQKDDILEAKETLMLTIQEIEETAKKQFLDAFTKAREHFIRVFRSLFTEDDSCDLVLVDPTQPLQSKIDIIAKPKGKRPLSISQLSGGEKTLTATALLFSLYLLKPAPFCIFDEVDAPLDDANIDKFNSIIRDFSKESQFIVVTHNKQTMAAVDTIFGVVAVGGVSSVGAIDYQTLLKQNEVA